MQTQNEIANLALNMLGHAYTINDIDESSTEARSVRAFWLSSLAHVLQARRWSFCEKRANLSVVQEPYFEYAYAYVYPSDCMVMRKLQMEGSKQPKGFSYEVAQLDDGTQVILCDVQNAIAHYSRSSPNNIYPYYLANLIAARLAVHLRSALASDANFNELMQKYNMFLIEAGALDANQQQIEMRHGDYRLLGARGQGYHHERTCSTIV